MRGERVDKESGDEHGHDECGGHTPCVAAIGKVVFVALQHG